MDAFGRIRIAQQFTTFEYLPNGISYINDEDIWINRPARGTGNLTTYNNNYNTIDMLVDKGSYSLRQTKQPMIYQPGKSRLIYMSFVPFINDVNGNIYVGLFSTSGGSVDPRITNDFPIITAGYYFYTDGKIISFCEVINDINGTKLNKIDQIDWNCDKFDGTGSSGLNNPINLRKTILIFFDQQYSVGRIRCGFIINGIAYYVHEFNHESLSFPYFKFSKLPLSYYITNTNTNNDNNNDNNSVAGLRQICSCNICEGEIAQLGKRLCCSTDYNKPITLNNSNINKKVILLAVRLNKEYPNGTFRPTSFSGFDKGTNLFVQFELQLHSTHGGQFISNISTSTSTNTSTNNIGTIVTYLNNGQTVSTTTLLDKIYTTTVTTNVYSGIGTINGNLTFSKFSNSQLEYSVGDGTQTISTDGFILDIEQSLGKVDVEFSVNELSPLLTRYTYTQYDTLYIVGLSGSVNSSFNATVDINEY